MSKDYFSTQSATYRQFRPTYPAALFDALATHLPAGARVLDCATGNGQAARAWHGRGVRVVASDLSFAQLSHAEDSTDIHYVQCRAEHAPFADRSFDLITIAQALHWFDFDAFYAEARRLLKPTGLLAAWTYSFLEVSRQLGADIDATVRWFYHDIIGSYWPPERRWVDEQYRTIPFPLNDLAVPSLTIELDWRLDDVLGYLGSWSAVALYRQHQGHDPVPLVAEKLRLLWPADESRHVSWPLDLRLGSFSGAASARGAAE